MCRICLILFILLISASPLFAAFAAQVAPEIDPGLAPSAIALLAGGLLVLKSKMKR